MIENYLQPGQCIICINECLDKYQKSHPEWFYKDKSGHVKKTCLGQMTNRINNEVNIVWGLATHVTDYSRLNGRIYVDSESAVYCVKHMVNILNDIKGVSTVHYSDYETW